MLLWLKLADPSVFVYMAISYLVPLICYLPYTTLYAVICDQEFFLHACFLPPCGCSLLTTGVTIHILYLHTLYSFYQRIILKLIHLPGK